MRRKYLPKGHQASPALQMFVSRSVELPMFLSALKHMHETIATLRQSRCTFRALSRSEDARMQGLSVIKYGLKGNGTGTAGGIARAEPLEVMGLQKWDSKGGSLSSQTPTATAHIENNRSGCELTPVQLPWFALQVRTKHELSIANSLRGRGYDLLVPLYQRRRVWSDRIKVVDAPLFPGYLFCRLNIQHRLPVLMTPGVIQIVGDKRRLVPVDEAEINAIQAMVTSGLPHQPWPFLRAGDRVQIERGPLRGLEGILVEVRGTHRLILSVTLVQRSVAVEIDSAFVKSLRTAPPSPTSTKPALCNSRLV